MNFIMLDEQDALKLIQVLEQRKADMWIVQMVILMLLIVAVFCGLVLLIVTLFKAWKSGEVESVIQDAFRKED